MRYRRFNGRTFERSRRDAPAAQRIHNEVTKCLRPTPAHLCALGQNESNPMKIVPYVPGHAHDWLQLLNLTRAAQLDMAEFAARELRWPTEDLRLRLVARLDGRTVAIGQLAVAPYSPPDHLSVLICTRQESRLSGFGSGLLQELEREARAMRYVGLTATIPEIAADALDWAERRGFRRYAVRFDSILDMVDSNTENLQKSAGHTIDVNLRNMTAATESDWHDVLSLFRALLAEAPDMEGLPNWTMARCRDVLRDNPAARDDWVIVARSGGRAIGLTVGHAMGKDIYSFFTGVSREWRGKGVGRALKQALIAAAREHGIATMRTTNLDRNRPAMQLNRSLGFQCSGGYVEIRKRLA